MTSWTTTTKSSSSYGNLGKTANTSGNISAAVFNQSKSFADKTYYIESMFFKPDGTKLFLLAEDSFASALTGIMEYSLSIPWDVTTSTFLRFVDLTEDGLEESIWFKPDGTAMYMLGKSGDEVNQYSLSTAWDSSTIAFVRVLDITADGLTNSTGLSFSQDGIYMYVSDSASDIIAQYTLSVAWDVSTATKTRTLSVIAQTGNADGIFFKEDGTGFYLNSSTTGFVYQYFLSTAWNISTATFTNYLTIPIFSYCSFLNPTGTQLFLANTSGNISVYEYALPGWANNNKETTTFSNQTKN